MDAIPLISIVVPIYNIAPYVRKCLDSLKNQAMREIEVLCIDDGSTDESGDIADEYASEEFPIFRVIHTDNRGLSAARNLGIDKARAGWLMFVDGDDYVEPEFCEIPYKAAVENDADLIIFCFDTLKNGKKTEKRQGKQVYGTIDEFSAHKFGGVEAWNKLYTRSLFDSIRYPEGHVFEDCATTHEIVHKARRIIVLRNVLYHHVFRADSITHRRSVASRRDCFIAIMKRRDYLETLGYPIKEFDNAIIGVGIGYLSVTPPCENEIYLRARDCVDSCKNIPSVLSLKQVIGFLAWKISPRLFILISRLIGRMK